MIFLITLIRTTDYTDSLLITLIMTIDCTCFFDDTDNTIDYTDFF